MTALRTTRPAEPRPLRPTRRVWMVSLAALGMFGCGTATPPPAEPPAVASVPPVGMNDPNWLTSRHMLPAPDTDRIDYNAGERKLTFYELPGRDRWMVQLPDEPAIAVGPTHRIPDGIDTGRIQVFYARQGFKVSIPVTVAQIAAGRAAHNSRIPVN